MRRGKETAGRLAGIEGLRAIAASSILVYHVWLYGAPTRGALDFGPLTKAFDNLRAGVTLFFVLSGFLLFRPYVAAALRRTPTPSTAAYLRNRALRILPAYWVILLAVAVLFERGLLRAPLQLASNLLFLQTYVPGHIPADNGGMGIVPAWSLAIEVIFYLHVPLLGGAAIWLALRSGAGRTAAALVPVWLMLVTGIAGKVVLRFLEGDLERVWSLTFFTHADWFAAGMALAVARVLWEDGRLRLPAWWGAAALAGALGLALLSLKLYYSGVLSGLEYQTPIAAACALLLGLVVLAPSSRLVRVLDSKPFFAAGLASYSLFLWHDPLVRGIRDAGLTLNGQAGFLVNLALIGFVSAVASTLTYRFVERPALARKRSWQREAQDRIAAEPGERAAPAPAPASAPAPATRS